MALRAQKLTAQQAGRLMRRFYKAYGPDVMRDAYWWESPKDASISGGEHAWAFYDDALLEGMQTGKQHANGGLIGWGTSQLQLDVADDDEAVMAAGVFPEFQRRGYRKQILDWMCDWAREQGANYAVTNTNNSNEAQIRRKRREAEQGGPWIYAGERWYPGPGYTIFVRDLNPEEETDVQDPR